MTGRNAWPLIAAAVLATVIALAIAPAGARADDTAAEKLYQKAWFEETANGDLERAAELYRSVVDQHRESADTAARAALRLGHCLVELGRSDEARKILERLVRERAEDAVGVEARAQLEAIAAGGEGPDDSPGKTIMLDLQLELTLLPDGLERYELRHAEAWRQISASGVPTGSWRRVVAAVTAARSMPIEFEGTVVARSGVAQARIAEAYRDLAPVGPAIRAGRAFDPGPAPTMTPASLAAKVVISETEVKLTAQIRWRTKGSRANLVGRAWNAAELTGVIRAVAGDRALTVELEVEADASVPYERVQAVYDAFAALEKPTDGASVGRLVVEIVTGEALPEGGFASAAVDGDRIVYRLVCDGGRFPDADEVAMTVRELVAGHGGEGLISSLDVAGGVPRARVVTVLEGCAAAGHPVRGISWERTRFIPDAIRVRVTGSTHDERFDGATLVWTMNASDREIARSAAYFHALAATAEREVPWSIEAVGDVPAEDVRLVSSVLERAFGAETGPILEIVGATALRIELRSAKSFADGALWKTNLEADGRILVFAVATAGDPAPGKLVAALEAAIAEHAGRQPLPAVIVDASGVAQRASPSPFPLDLSRSWVLDFIEPVTRCRVELVAATAFGDGVVAEASVSNRSEGIVYRIAALSDTFPTQEEIASNLRGWSLDLAAGLPLRVTVSADPAVPLERATALLEGCDRAGARVESLTRRPREDASPPKPIRLRLERPEGVQLEDWLGTLGVLEDRLARAGIARGDGLAEGPLAEGDVDDALWRVGNRFRKIGEGFRYELTSEVPADRHAFVRLILLAPGRPRLVPVAVPGDPQPDGADLRKAVTVRGDRLVLREDQALELARFSEVTVRPSDRGDGTLSIELTLAPADVQAVARLTQAQLGKPVAFCLDGKILAAPVVRAAIGGKAVIDAGFSEDEAELLSVLLGSGPAPLRVTIEDDPRRSELPVAPARRVRVGGGR